MVLYFAVLNLMNEFKNLSLEDTEYILNLPYHLERAGMADDLCTLLSEFEFVKHKIFASKVQELIEDYNFALQPSEISISEGKNYSLKLIQRTIQLSANILQIDKTQLFGQLLGRLLSFDTLEIREILKQTKQCNITPWLCPLTASLIPPMATLLRTLQGHTKAITDVVVTPNNQKLVSASADCTLKIWDLQQGIELYTLKGHTDGISGVAITSDGKYCVSSSWDGTIRIWDLELGAALRTLENHTKGITAVAITPDGQIVVSASQDYTRKVWDFKSGQLLASYPIAYKPPTDFPILVNGQVHKLSIRKAPVSEEIAITLDGKKVISASNHCGPNNTTLRVWHLTNGTEEFYCSDMSELWKLVSMPDGEHFISAGAHTIRMWNLKTQEELFNLSSKTYIESIALTANGQCLLSASGNKIMLWDLNNRREIGSLGNHNQIKTITVLPNGKQAISGAGDGSLKLWNLDNRLEEPSQFPHKNSVEAVVVLPNSQRAISGSRDGTLKIWNLQNYENLLTLKYHRAIQAVVAMPDEQYIISGSQDGSLKIWNLQSGTELYSLTGEIMPSIQCSTSTGNTLDIPSFTATPVQALVITPDKQKVICGLADGSIQIWNLKKKSTQFQLIGHTQEISGLAITSDGKQVISSSFDGTLRIWDLETQKILGVIHSHDHPINSIALIPDNQHIISASHDGTIKMWHLPSRKNLFTIKAHKEIIWAVAVLPNRYLAVSASNDGTLKVWNLINKNLIATFTAENPLKCCAVVDKYKLTIVAGEELGQVHFLQLQGIK